MNALIKAPRKASVAALPVQAIDDLAKNVNELSKLSAELERILRGDRGEYVKGRWVRYRLPLPEIPAHMEATVGLMQKVSMPATERQVLDALSVLAGMFGPKGDADTIASLGVTLLMAEGPSVMALYAATLALIRPVPGERPSSKNEWQGTSPKPRLFPPTLSEIIAQLREQQNLWNWNVAQIGLLLKRHAEIEEHLKALKAA